ncbi:hypothetical protein [Allosphingosinicella deserti]|uniref:hypothetical protein n=1 Tax=Allosphingosinicella deserti TaxID=2116704 RepID=UPI0011B20EC8|nr:hypothetical protein [Sphingomonas deserti]
MKFHIRALEGLCYAPQSIMFNGHLSLDGFDGVDRWVLEPADPTQVEGLDDILSAGRVKIGSGNMVLSVPRDAVVKRTFHVQFVAFSCGAGRVSNGVGKVHIGSVAADLPLSEIARQGRETSDRSEGEGLMVPR